MKRLNVLASALAAAGALALPTTAWARFVWGQRAPGAGQLRNWFGSPYHGLVPSGTYGVLSRHSRGVALRLPGTSTQG